MLIKIIKGTYGHRDGKKIVAKTAKDDPFEVSAEKAERLIRLQVAVKASPAEVEIETGAESKTIGETAAPFDVNIVESWPAYKKDMPLPALRDIAALVGIELPDDITRAGIVTLLNDKKTAILAQQDEINSEEADGPPQFDAAPPVQQ